jgi:ribosomal protein S18 acetylase RimI-like enzyme
MIVIKKVALNKLNKLDLYKMRDCFRESFPKDGWKASFPHEADTVYLAKLNNVVLGFCVIHCPPYRFKDTTGLAQTYIYNLCVAPIHRRTGAGAALLRAVKTDYPHCCCHVLIDNPYHVWFAKQGFNIIGKWREIYIEYVGWETKAKLAALPTPNLRNYDPEEGIIYLT